MNPDSQLGRSVVMEDRVIMTRTCPVMVELNPLTRLTHKTKPNPKKKKKKKGNSEITENSITQQLRTTVTVLIGYTQVLTVTLCCSAPIIVNRDHTVPRLHMFTI